MIQRTVLIHDLKSKLNRANAIDFYLAFLIQILKQFLTEIKRLSGKLEKLFYFHQIKINND